MKKMKKKHFVLSMFAYSENIMNMFIVGVKIFIDSSEFRKLKYT